MELMSPVTIEVVPVKNGQALKDKTGIGQAKESQEKTIALAKNRKKGGPYNKITRQKNREEVLRLYFEYGYPEVKIARMLNINRHTVREYIKYWLTKLDTHKTDFSEFVEIQVYRKEIQRARQVERLHKETDFSKIMAIEEMIRKIDKDLDNFELKCYNTAEVKSDSFVKKINEFFKYHNIDKMYFDSRTIAEMSESSMEKIRKIINEDENWRATKW